MMASKRADYDALAVDPTIQRSGLLGGLGHKVSADGKHAFEPWETTELRTLALNPGIANAIAATHGVSASEVLEVGAWNLSNQRDGVNWFGTGASEFLSRTSIANHAAYERAMGGWHLTVESANAIEQANVAREKKKRIEEDRLNAARRETRLKAQDEGASVTSDRATKLQNKMLCFFNDYRKTCRHSTDVEVYENVAARMNALDDGGKPTVETQLTLQGNLHTANSVRQSLSVRANELTPKIKRAKNC